jgi:hypothetical protein
VAPALEVRPLAGSRGMRDWLRVPHLVYAGDPAWVAPLDVLERFRISRKHAAIFGFGDAQFFLAYRGDQPAGRISAHFDRRYLQLHGDGTGSFGFFECLHDPEAAAALVAAAADWLSRRGMSRMVGPLNFTTNEECGCLISGFDTPPAVLMPHGRPWIGPLLEGAGLSKEIDLFAYRVSPGELAKRVGAVAAHIDPETMISLRFLDSRRFAEDIDLLVEIFNDAWSANWGFVPLSRKEIEELVSRTRWLVREDLVRFGVVGGKTIAVAVSLPNFNEVIAPFRGRLLPFNWIKLIRKFWSGDIRSGRVSLLGLRSAYQSTPLAGAFLALVARDMLVQSSRYTPRWLEFSWVVETNKRMVRMAERFAGQPSKVYRIYSRAT